MAEALTLTPAQEQLMEQHRAQDEAQTLQTLTPEQQAQLDRDLARLLPDGLPKDPPGRLEPAEPLPDLQVERFEPVYGPSASLVTHPTESALHWRGFPMGGCVMWGKPAWMQRVDQGQDFEVLWGRSIIAPGWGHCVGYLHDRPFPYGFGSPYMVVYIGNGRFGGRLWYLGHMNYVQIRPGESFHFGRALGRLYNSLNVGRGWIEWGHAANGYPMAMGEGWKWHSLFTSYHWQWYS